MPLELLIFIASTLLGATGVAIRKGGALSDRIDALELKVAEKYERREELYREFDRIHAHIDRINEKLNK